MNPSTLPGRALQGDLDGGLEALVGLRDDQVNASKTTISQRREEPCRQRFRFTVAKIDTEYFPVPVSTNTESNHDCLGDDFPAHSGLAIRCIEEHSTQQGIGEIRVAERDRKSVV